MISKDILQLLGVFGLSAIKFGIAGVPAAVFAKFNFFKAVTITSLGGFSGTLFFVYFNSWIIKLAKAINRAFKRHSHKAKFPRRIHTRTNRIIVKVRKRFGLLGLSIITPLLLSIPLGTFIAVRYYSDKQQIIIYMFISIFIQSIVLFLFYNFIYGRLITLI